MSTAGQHSADSSEIVEPAPEYARLVIRNPFGALATKDVLRPTTLIGGQPGCNVHLVSPEIAPAHCVLTRESDGFSIRDLRSAAGTVVDGTRIEVAPLVNGTEIQIGPFFCTFETNVASDPARRPVSVDEGTTTAAFQLSPGAEQPGGKGGAARLVLRNREGAVVRKLLSRRTTLIGGLPTANVQLVAPEISPAHCLVTRESDGLRIRDLRSRNGTRVNGTAMDCCRLRNGDSVEIGPFVCLVETEVESTADGALDRIDQRFHFEPPEHPRPDERAAIEAAKQQLAKDQAQLAAAHDEFEQLRQSLTVDQTKFEHERETLRNDRAELDTLREELARERETFQSGKSELNMIREELLRERDALAKLRLDLDQERQADTAQKRLDVEALESERATHSASLASFDALRAVFDGERRDFEQAKSSLEKAQADHQSKQETLDNERRSLAQSFDNLAREREQLAADSEKLKSATSTSRKEETRLKKLAAKVQADSEALEQNRRKLADDESRLKSEQAELLEKAKEVESQRRELDSVRSKLHEADTVHKREMQRMRDESERSRSVAEQLSADLTGLEQQKTQLLSQMQLVAVDSDALRTDQAKLNAAFEALAEERRSIEADRKRIAEREAALDTEGRRIDERQTQLQIDAKQLEVEHDAATSERARLSTELQEVTSILAHLRVDRQKFTDELQKLHEQREELTAEADRISQQQQAVSRALAELEIRNEEVTHRREQLKAEQAYLRSGKRQFQGALDEFRAEQIRFRQAVASIKAYRKGFTRRREARAELQAIRASHWAIPLKAEWILDGELEGLSDDDGALLGVLDIGESGRIYVIEDRQTNRRIAVKLIQPSPEDPARLDQLESAWRTALDFRHPNLVQALRVDRHNSCLRLFTEYVEAINLRELIALHGSLPWREVASYAFQAALALEAVHETGRAHGGVIPSHVLIESDGTLRLLLSGCESVDPDALRAIPTGAPIPEIVDYLAPEAARENPTVDPQSDLYQLGCILHHALAGQVPFAVPSAAEKLEFHATKLAAPLRPAAHDAPKEMLLAVKKLMAKQPSERFASATEAAQAFATFARRRPAWFSFESVLTARSERASRTSGPTRVDVADSISAALRTDGGA